MTELLWGIRCESRHGTADTWYGYWRSRREALAYATNESAGVGDPGELASMHADWLAVEPIEWADGRDVNLVVKNRPWPTANGSQRIAGGPDG